MTKPRWLFLLLIVAGIIGLAQSVLAQGTSVNAAAPDLFVVRVYYADRAQLAELTGQYDVWEVKPAEGYVVIGATRAELAALIDRDYRVSIDLAKTIEANLPRAALPGQTNGIPGYPCYRTVEETYQTGAAIAAAHPDLAEWIDIGDSWEKITPGGAAGYDLMVLKLTNHAVPGPKPVYFAMSSVHAREYAPAELNTRFAEYLVDNYGVDPDVTWLLDFTEVHLLLQANPDGRKWAESGSSWRKNTNNNYCANTSSRGADLNRNWPFMWNSCAPGLGCSSGSQCDPTYRGSSAASEPETQATLNYVRSIFPDYRPVNDLTTPVPITATGMFFDLHSYSQLVLWPWGFTYDAAPNAAALQTLGRKLAYFNGYTPQQSVGLYPTDGTTDDTTYGELGIPAYTIEMGTSFFQDCASFDSTINPANRAALLYALKAAHRPYTAPGGPDVLGLSAVPATVPAGTPVALNASANDTRFNNSNGAEPVQAIAAARYAFDRPSWLGAATYPMSPGDGAYNTPVEAITAQLNTAGLTPGRHTVFVEAQDAAGNWGLPTAVFISITADSGLAGVVRGADASPVAGALVEVGSGRVPTDAAGRYALALMHGVYTVTASAYGYASQTLTDVVLAPGLTTTQDITLTALSFYTLTGRVTDALTGAPLPASIDIGGYPYGPLVADAGGYYHVSLAAGGPYTLTVGAAGYGPVTRPIGLLTADRLEDFALEADVVACSAPGYGWLGVRESFAITPATWTVTGTLGGANWRFDDPGGRTNLTGGAGGFAIADSDYFGAGQSTDTALMGPPMNLSAVPTPTLTFKTDFNYYIGNSSEVADVDVSVDGTAWINVWRQTAGYRGPQTVSIDLPQLGGQPAARVRFRYYHAGWEAWWQVDDVRLGVCAPLTGAWTSTYLPLLQQ